MGAAGCAAVPPAAPSPAPPLRVGTSGDYAPFSSRGADGALAGFDVEVARAYAAERGRTLVFVPFHWRDLGTRLAAGDFDVVMSGVTVGPDRLVGGIFTATVARADAVLAVRTSSVDGGAADTRRVPSFDRPEWTIGVNRGGHLEQVARTRFPRAAIVAVDDNARLPELLTNGAADAIVTDTLELEVLAARGAPDGAGPCLRVAARLSHDEKAYWLPVANVALAADLDAWLLARERSGWLPALRARLLAGAAETPLGAAEASLVGRIRRRLALMPAVAAAKRAHGLPIEDRAREAAVERDAVARAAAVGLDPESFVAFLRAEIAAAKAIQGATPVAAAPTHALDELRQAINRLDARIAVELAALAPVRASETAIAAALADEEVPGISARVARALARRLRGVRASPATGRAHPPLCMLRTLAARGCRGEVADGDGDASMGGRDGGRGVCARGGGSIGPHA